MHSNKQNAFQLIFITPVAHENDYGDGKLLEPWKGSLILLTNFNPKT